MRLKEQIKEIDSMTRIAGEHDLYHYFLDSDMSYEAKKEMMTAWSKRFPRVITNPDTLQAQGKL